MTDCQSSLDILVRKLSGQLGENEPRALGDFAEEGTELLQTPDGKLTDSMPPYLRNLDPDSPEFKERMEAWRFEHDMLQVIVNISERTNLLALNATIEAARAGTAGKGFSVVANEVKNLSNQTKSAAEDITKAVEEINSQSLRVTESMDNSAEMCEDIRTIISEFDTRLHATNAANQRAMNKIYSTKDMIFMVLAKLDHVIWKTNTYRSVLHREQMFDFVDHHSCRLGKWYTTGEGRTGFGHVNSYRELERPHSVVHNGTKRVFEMLDYDENDCEELEAALKVMEEGSDGVFRVLDRMLSEKR